MGCDVFYQCDASDKDKVLRLVSIIERWAKEKGRKYVKVKLENRILKIGPRKREVDLLGIFVEWFDWDPIENPDFEYNYGTYIDCLTRGQFIFDFRQNGTLVRCAINPKSYQSSESAIECLLYESGGYWRSIGDYNVLPRFLTWCKIRYLPKLEFSSDYLEAEHFMNKFFHNQEMRDKISSLSDEEFYRQYVSKFGIFG